MDNMNEIENLIKESLRDIRQLYEGKDIESKILFPKYSDNEPRYSEQELKCIFIKKLESRDFYFSVETPSQYKYRFVDNDEPRVLLKGEEAKEKEIFQSSMIDLSLYDKGKNLISHIEFKHGQCPVFPVQKDFLKLLCESDAIANNYFVHYLDKSDSGTKKAIFNKYKIALRNISETNENISNELAERLKKVFVFVLFAGMKSDDNYFWFSLDTLNKLDITLINGEYLD